MVKTAKAPEATTSYDDLSKNERACIGAAVSLFAKHLDKLADEALAVGKNSDAGAYKAEATSLRDALTLKLVEKTVVLRPHEREAVKRGLAFYVKNLRAAKGTMLGLAKPALADDFEEEAVQVESELVPQFDDQIALKV